MTESLFGQLVHPYHLEQQTVRVYETWMFEYLAEVERKEGLRKKTVPRPPAPESFHGGIDFLSWKANELPKVIVNVEPTGMPERDASLGYTQDFEIKVACIVKGLGTSTLAQLPEDEARAIASYYGAASMLLEDQRPELTSDLFMVETPRLSFPASDDRSVCQSTVAFHCFVSPVKLLSSGPVWPVPKESPEYPGEPEGKWGQEPEVTKVEEKVVGEPIT